MVYPTKVFRPIASVCTALSILAFAAAALADTASDPNNASVVDPGAGFSSPDGGGGIFEEVSGPMDLIHRAVLMNDMSLSDFQQYQRNRFADEAANFRLLQQEALQREATTEAVDAPGTEESPSETE